ncbi:MAG: hypothetical protein QOG71_129 [Pyrinomonadaceae bacterium]|nr:hypothetical protein [Pyrinomonadaceae bacterium]
MLYHHAAFVFVKCPEKNFAQLNRNPCAVRGRDVSVGDIIIDAAAMPNVYKQSSRLQTIFQCTLRCAQVKRMLQFVSALNAR